MRFTKNSLAACALAILAIAFAPSAFAQIFFDSGGESFVAYNYHTDYASNPNGDFSVTYYATFAPTDFEPSFVQGTFGISLTDATPNGTGVTATDLVQTTTLSFVSGNVVVASTDVPAADFTLPTLSISNRGTATESTQSVGFPGYVTGPLGTYNELSVTITGTLSSGSQLGATGVVDVEVQNPVPAPEPSSLALVLLSLIFGLFLRKKLVRLVPAPVIGTRRMKLVEKGRS
jgi:hypothetical protein